MPMRSVLSFSLPLLSALTAFGGEPVRTAVTSEQRYFETRDGFIRQFQEATTPVNGDDRQALVELEKQLRTIMGPLEAVGFPEEGRINLETLREDGGFGQVDGLRFGSKSETLFVTTETLLKNYLSTHPTLPGNLSELSKTGEFYHLVFYWDAAVTHFAEVPVTSTKGQSFASAFLGLIAQDIGPSAPNTLFVLVSKGDKRFLVSASTKAEITQIPECKSDWDKFAEKAADALGTYRSSQKKDAKAFDDHVRYEKEGFEAYRRCFGGAARSQEWFPPLTRQAQSIVDRLQ